MICGSGLGAAIALVFAAKHPQLVAKLVLVDVGDDELRPFLEEEDDEDEVEEQEERDGDARDHPHRRGAALAAAPSASPRFSTSGLRTRGRSTRFRRQRWIAPSVSSSASAPPRSGVRAEILASVRQDPRTLQLVDPREPHRGSPDRPEVHPQPRSALEEERRPRGSLAGGEGPRSSRSSERASRSSAATAPSLAASAERLANTLRRGAGDAAPVSTWCHSRRRRAVPGGAPGARARARRDAQRRAACSRRT